jgi:hypothetical protein
MKDLPPRDWYDMSELTLHQNFICRLNKWLLIAQIPLGPLLQVQTRNSENKKCPVKLWRNELLVPGLVTPGEHWSRCGTPWKLLRWFCSLSLGGRASNPFWCLFFVKLEGPSCYAFMSFCMKELALKWFGLRCTWAHYLSTMDNRMAASMATYFGDALLWGKAPADFFTFSVLMKTPISSTTIWFEMIVAHTPIAI